MVRMKKDSSRLSMEAMDRLSLKELLILYERVTFKTPYYDIKEKMGGKDFVSHEQIRLIYFGALEKLRKAFGIEHVDKCAIEELEETE